MGPRKTRFRSFGGVVSQMLVTEPESDMVNGPFTLISSRMGTNWRTMDDADFDPLPPLDRLVLAYAPASARAAVTALFALDRKCAGFVRGAQEPLLAQIRLQWWQDVLAKPVHERAAGQPLLAALDWIIPETAMFADLEVFFDSWNRLAEAPDPDRAAMEEHARLRGGLFALAGKAAGASADHELLARVGAFWAFWDHARSPLGEVERDQWHAALVENARTLPDARLGGALRPLAIWRSLALADCDPARFAKPLMRPATYARIVRTGLTGL